MEYGDPEPAHILSLNALRCLKYKTEIDTFADHDPFLAVCKLKRLNLFTSIIRDIGLDPFYVHY